MTKLRVEFAPGFFDQFDGTQEELDQTVSELMAEIQRMADSGELENMSDPVDLESLTAEERDLLERAVHGMTPNRVLH